jgi:hypothetical protein
MQAFFWHNGSVEKVIFEKTVILPAGYFFCRFNVKGNGQQGFPVKLIESNTVPNLFQYLKKTDPCCPVHPLVTFQTSNNLVLIYSTTVLSEISFKSRSKSLSDQVNLHVF